MCEQGTSTAANVAREVGDGCAGLAPASELYPVRRQGRFTLFEWHPP